MSDTSRTGDDRLRSILRCPKDGYSLTPVTVGSATVDHCDHCGAVWLDAGELALLQKHPDWVSGVDTGGERGARPVMAPHGRVCPRDGTSLAESRDHRQKHIRVDKCPTCLGLLLDAGELTDLTSFTLKERLRAIVG